MFARTLFTLVYVVSADVLLMHRDKRPADVHFGKYVGLGGRMERDEDVVTGACREIQEESGLVARDLVLRGTAGQGHYDCRELAASRAR